MEEDSSVYVIRLSKDAPKVFESNNVKDVLPSEKRYSANFVLGLGIVHVAFGLLSATFAILAFFSEPDGNRYAAGLWAGIVYIGCGILGVLAHAKWYVREQIVYFFLGNLGAGASAIIAFALTIYGVHLRSFRVDFIGDAVTANVLITSVMELAWSVLSARVAIKGAMSDEYEFESPNEEEGGEKSGGVSAPKKKHEYVLSAKLPPGYSASGILADPNFICHLTEKSDRNRFHVSRVNPIHEKDENSSSCWTSEASSACSTNKKKDKKSAMEFLSRSAELAARNSVELNHTFRSVAL